MNPLEQLAEKYKPSKRLHDYLPHYWMHFRDRCNEVRSILEIGVDNGSSLFMWKDFFPNAHICGLDINPACKKHESKNISVQIGSQADPEILSRLNEKYGPFDIIIDDGSHLSEHQLFSFRYFIKLMNPEGIYVIEDIGVNRGHDRTWVNHAMTGLVDNINYWDYDLPAEAWTYMNKFPTHASWLDRHIIGVAFYRFICFVMRGDNPGKNSFLRDKSLAPRR